MGAGPGNIPTSSWNRCGIRNLNREPSHDTNQLVIKTERQDFPWMLCKYLLHLFNPKLKKEKNYHFQMCFLEGTWCLSLKPTFRGHTDGPAVAPGHRFFLCVESVPISIWRIMWNSHFHPTNLKCDTGDLVTYLGSFQCFFSSSNIF